MKPLSETGLIFLLIQLAIWSSGIMKIFSWLIGVAPLAFVLNYWRQNPQTFKSLFRPAGNEKYYLLMFLTFLIFFRAIALAGDGLIALVKVIIGEPPS